MKRRLISILALVIGAISLVLLMGATAPKCPVGDKCAGVVCAAIYKCCDGACVPLDQPCD